LSQLSLHGTGEGLLCFFGLDMQLISLAYENISVCQTCMLHAYHTFSVPVLFRSLVPGGSMEYEYILIHTQAKERL